MKLSEVPGAAERSVLNFPGKICTVDTWGRVSVGSEFRGKKVVVLLAEVRDDDLGPFQKQ